MLTFIDLKFTFDSACLGLFSSTKLIFSKSQMSPFELRSCCSCHYFSYNFA